MIKLPDKVKRAVIRGWGNAYIGWEMNQLPMIVINDWDRIARAVEMTDEEKQYAVKLMDGDCYEHNGRIIYNPPKILSSKQKVEDRKHGGTKDGKY